MKAKSIRGFNDILPEDTTRWCYVEEKAKATFEPYGFSEIRIPIVEFTEVFVRSLGTSTDVVEKEMYTFTDRDNSSITLRPEGTAGVVRAYVEHSMHAKSSITKLYYSGMMFRHERPQKGRYRGFYQIGAELFGSIYPTADAEIITMLMSFFEATGLSQYVTLELNSLGDENCKPRHKEKIIEYFTPLKGDLCEDCQRRLKTNPLRILDCKNPSCEAMARNSPSMLENLCDECKNHFEAVKENLNVVGVQFTINPRIVRGLDYYNRTVFEITTDRLGAQNAVAAGGRYDGLVKELGGPKTPAVGFAMGIDRIILLHKLTAPSGFEKEVDLFIAHLGKEALKKSFSLAYELRRIGVHTEMDYGAKSLKSQLRRADKSGAKYAFIIGEDELSRGKLTVRDMRKSSEEEVDIEEICKSAVKYKS